MKSFTNEGDVDSDVRVTRPVQALERLAHNLFLGQWEVLDETLPWKVDEEDEKDDDCENDDCCDYQAVGKSDLKRRSEIVAGQTLLNLDHFFHRVTTGGTYIGLSIRFSNWYILMIPALKKQEMFSSWLMQCLSNYHLGSVCISSFASTSLMS